ncbi:hypothetical protein CHO01_15740 [Cellulomonas hominis]|uniref:DUF3515 domain-containing protein n=1 Tax=Cellulomonas hominis TaxID=156981 RepID=A0A511FF54_9CELL|nr:DUF3515 family protein [Cellulomonas hominis]MBB5471599.1 hypothetical protein [Cellulomonas hominis]GEL46458.1 hypothetical protein CHO01_15740 [Cellulomonas hominis]
MNRRTARPAAVALAGAAVLAPALAACAPSVGVAVAPHATDPDCARVVLTLPDSLGDGLDAVRTTSQATAAWGDPAGPVTLRCGVEVPGPTTEQCVTVETASGPSIDWLVQADAEPADGEATPNAPSDPAQDPGSSDWTFVTYGRDPAVEVHVPAAVVAERSTSFLDGLSVAVAQVEATRSCL